MAFLVLLFVLALGALSLFVAAFRPSRPVGVTPAALAEARAALIGHAALYPELKETPFAPGILPCPDQEANLGQDGVESGTCGVTGVSALGYFPWRSLGIAAPRDDSGECLWYLVSGTHKANPKAALVNPEVEGLIDIDDEHGKPLARGALAVLFAPGPPLPGQQREDKRAPDADITVFCRQDYRPQAFLESLPHGIAPAFERTVVRLAPDGNDRIVWLDRAALWQTIEKRPNFAAATFDADWLASGQPAVAQRLAACLIGFAEANAHHRFPWAASLALTATTSYEAFHNVRLTDKKNLLAGRPPFSVGYSQQVLNASLGQLPQCTSADYSNAACRLLRVDACAEFWPVAGDVQKRGEHAYKNSPDGWWDKWKDRYFYAVAPGFAPAAAPALTAASCAATPAQCLWLDERPCAAIIAYAGPPLAHQRRATLAEKLDPANYLEGATLSVLQGQSRHVRQDGNDRLVCITPPPSEDGAFEMVSLP
jgi:hypothetical protein